MNLPIEFSERMKRLLKTEYDAFLEALQNENDVKGLRVNTHKVSVETFLQNAPFQLSPISYVEGGFIVLEEARAGKHPYHHAGAYYLQDPGAMSAVAAIPSDVWQKERLRVLDLCAAPGGKTTQLASLCEATGGVVFANEYVSSRSRILAGNVERMGHSNVCVTNLDSRDLAQQYPDSFDLVVVDAPCSGEGMYRKNDLAISEWSLQNVKMCAVRQKEILENAARCVCHGGLLLYSTCTYSTEENEETIAEFLRTHSDFSLIPCDAGVVASTADGIPVSDAGGADLTLCRRFYPHVCAGEGQFAALMKRMDGEDECPVQKRGTESLGKGQQKAAEAFLKETLGYIPHEILLRHGYLSLFPNLAASGLPLPRQTVAVGTPIGEERKGRIVPHHHFFMSYGKDFLSQLVLDAEDERVKKYLYGEEIEIPANLSGYTAVLLRCGDEVLTLGGGKAVSGRLKNYYPKGLRTT